MKKAIIVGASSGIGQEVARLLNAEGWSLGLAARRKDRLEQLRDELKQVSGNTQKIAIEAIDINGEHATDSLEQLIDRIGGIDLYFHAAGIGWQNAELCAEKETKTVETNALGFTKMIDFVFNKMSCYGFGHIAIISSIAGTKGMGAAPAYSATKAFQNKYIEALEQLVTMRGLNIHFTDIRPGFVATDLINGGKGFPMLMTAQDVAKQIVSAINKKQHVHTIDWRWHIVVLFWRMIPRAVWRILKVGK